MNKTQKEKSFIPFAGLFRLVSFLRVATVIVLLAQAFDLAAQAQTVRFRSPTTRVTVPLGYASTIAFTNTCSVSGLVNPVDFTITGLPAGVTYTITATNGAALPLDGGLPSTSMSTNLLITLTFDGTELQGLTTASVTAANGAVNNWPFYVQVAKIWSGADYIAAANTNWNDGGNWVGGSAPGSSDDVVFAQTGATNVATITNVIITANTTVSSVRFAPTNSAKFYTVLINSGATLATTGAQSLSLLRDSENFLSGNASGVTVTFVGGGTLSVNNENGNIVSHVDNGQQPLLDLSGLGNFSADVNQILIGDSVQSPFFRAYNDQNGYGGQPRQSLSSLSLARTNVIKAVYADPNNYTNSDNRHWGFSFLNSELTGSSTTPNVNFGISNIFYIDSINLTGGNSRGNAQFNSVFNASNPIAIFRGTNGGRMNLYSQADGGGTNTANSNIKSTVQFLAGTLDMLVDRFYIGRDRVQIQFNSTPNYQGFFLMGRGILDVNTMILGFREHPGAATNSWSGYNGYCEGQFTVSNGVAKINKSLTLGYTTESNAQGLGSLGNTEYGQVTIRDGGTIMANTINVGGPVYGSSKNNFIIVSNSATLNISNSCGSMNQLLDFIAFANNSTLTVNLDALSTNALVYAASFNMTAANSLVIASIRHPLSLVNGQLIPLLKRTAGGAPSFTVVNQSGVNGSVVVDPNDANQLDFQIILNTPKNLLWKGYTSADWDNTTANWLDLATGLHTNFAAGDNVAFDDTASQFSLNLISSAVILPGPLNMTNTINAYTFNNNSGGSIIGTSTLNKYGASSLEIDGASSISVTLNSGSLLGSGSVGSVTVNSGAVANFSGSISGNLSSAGVATSSGILNGALTVNNGGVVTNAGTMNSTFSVGSGGLFVNNPGASLATIGSSSSVSSGGTMVNRGSITGVNLGVAGTFKDTGEGTTTLTGTFTANAGATILPGGDGVATTTIQNGSASGFPGRVLLSSGSTNIFKVDIIGGINTKLLSGFQDFGGSSSARVQDGCTLIITNVTGNFAIGQTFTFFQYAGGGNPLPTGTSTNRYPIISPASPGSGMAWDLTQLWPSGVIGVITNLGPVFTNSFTIDSGTNIIGQFSWDAANYGWRLLNKTVPAGAGLEYTNQWTGISGSWTNTAVTLTNTITTNNVFYRLVFP